MSNKFMSLLYVIILKYPLKIFSHMDLMFCKYGVT